MKDHNFQAILFDLDGTLLDTTEGVIASVMYTITISGLEIPNENKLLSFIGPPIQESFINHYGVTSAKAQRLAEIFRDRYKNTDLLKAVPYEGIYEVLGKLKESDYKIAVATYKRQDYAEIILEHFEFNRFIDITCGGDQYNQLKKSDIIKKCIDSINIADYKNCIMIGDTLSDAVGAEVVGCAFAGVTYGFGFRDKNEMSIVKSLGYAKNTKDLLTLLL